MVQHYSIIFFLFFSRTFLRAQLHVLWELQSQERHYLLLCCFSLRCFSNWAPGTSRGPLWCPTMFTFKRKNNLVSLLFHVLDIKSVRGALAVRIFRFIPSVARKRRPALNRCLLRWILPQTQQWLHSSTSEQTHLHRGEPSDSWWSSPIDPDVIVSLHSRLQQVTGPDLHQTSVTEVPSCYCEAPAEHFSTTEVVRSKFLVFLSSREKLLGS